MCGNGEVIDRDEGKDDELRRYRDVDYLVTLRNLAAATPEVGSNLAGVTEQDESSATQSVQTWEPVD